MTEECHAPYCEASVDAEKPFCRTHWMAIDYKIRSEFQKHARVLATGTNQHVREQYLQSLEQCVASCKSKMQGRHVVSECRAKDCDKEITWLPTSRGKSSPTDFDTVDPDDQMFDPKKHTSHFATCADPDAFRKGFSRRGPRR